MTRSNLGAFALAFGLTLGLGGVALLHAGGFFNQRAVGGVAITTDGVLEAPTTQDSVELEQLRKQTPLKAPAALEELAELRAVSLKQVEATLQKCAQEGQPVPEEVQYLAGLLRVRYVFVYPERNDIVIAGPAEGWEMDALGNIVGVTTKRPVLLLDNLMVGLRSGGTSRTEPITCSIDPREEGIQRVQAYLKTIRNIGDPDETLARIEEALGPQDITVTGVPETSRFARTMVAADFRMKRIAMDFEPAPVEGMPSFLSMMKATGRGMSNMMPRWWLAPNYQPLAKSQDGLAWELRGQGVKCMTNEDYVSESGQKTAAGTKNPVAEKWAQTMTAKFDELAAKDSAFGELRNIMDLAVIGALIEKEHLLDVADLQLPQLMGQQPLNRYPAAKTTASKASAVKQGRDWLISASGGVEMLPWHTASEVETVEAVAKVRSDLAAGEVKDFWYE
ncbi:MAG: hypothetical protein DCC67_12260 [Planctomycetota bacterium]|nr:MAG: hypothetical protein DCC67_12260 [Planctomycetota bacterium]